jgi:polysaccharide export outer membrane protein
MTTKPQPTILALSRIADRRLALGLAVTMTLSPVAFDPTNYIAQASESASDTQVSTHVDSEVSNFTRDYLLAPGDRLNIVVYDEPQLSGKFVIDGGGSAVLPLIGPVSLKGITTAEAQQTIQQRLADGVLVQPAVSVSIEEFRPIFVTGNVRKPGSYPFILGQSVKAAVAAAGGEGEPLDFSFRGALSEFINAEQRVRQLEMTRTTLLTRKARLEAQRDGHESFVIPTLVGFGHQNADFDLAFSSENETLSRLTDVYKDQIATLQSQRPRIEAEISAVINQIEKQKERLTMVNSRLVDLEHLFRKGLLRKDTLVNQQIERSLVEGQVSALEAQIARLRQAMGDIDVRLGDAKATHLRETLAQLQETSERLREVELNLGPARKLLSVTAQGASGDFDETDYVIRVSRMKDGGMVTFDVTGEAVLLPGDVVEVRLKRRVADTGSPFATEVRRELHPISSVAEGGPEISK